MDHFNWHIGKPFFGSPFSPRKRVRPLRDLFVLCLLTVILALTFKHEISIIQQKGWQAWPEALASIIHQFTHPL